MPVRQVVLLTPSESFRPAPVTFSPTARLRKSFSCNTYGSPASVANKRLAAELNPLDATLTKTGGWGPRLSVIRRSALRAPCSLSLVTCHFFRPLLSTAYTLFEVPYPVTPLLACPPGRATLLSRAEPRDTKTAGCIPTFPILDHLERLMRRELPEGREGVGSALKVKKGQLLSCTYTCGSRRSCDAISPVPNWPEGARSWRPR